MTIRDVLRVAKRRSKALVQQGVARGVLANRFSYSNRAEAVPDTPHFLIARYNYYAADASKGPSIEQFLLDNTLAAAHAGTADTFFWEGHAAKFPRSDWALLERVRTVRPDVIILSSYEPNYPTQPSVETIRILRRKWNIPIVAVWWDSCWQGFWRSIVPVLPYVDVHVVPDNPRLNFFDAGLRAQYGRRFLALWEAMDPALYNNPGLPRDIEVAFLGQVAGYRSERTPYLQYLVDHQVPLYSSMANRAEQPSHEHYIEVLKRTKIGLNFSWSVDSHQLKSRVFETISCGALLMENDNEQTHTYLTPGQDYVSFDSPADLADKIRYYLDHADERIAMAANGEQKVRALYNCQNFWKAIIDKLKEVRNVPL